MFLVISNNWYIVGGSNSVCECVCVRACVHMQVCACWLYTTIKEREKQADLQVIENFPHKGKLVIYAQPFGGNVALLCTH